MRNDIQVEQWPDLVHGILIGSNCHRDPRKEEDRGPCNARLLSAERKTNHLFRAERPDPSLS